jgi:hypothetical protein
MVDSIVSGRDFSAKISGDPCDASLLEKPLIPTPRLAANKPMWIFLLEDIPNLMLALLADFISS